MRPTAAETLADRTVSGTEIAETDAIIAAPGVDPGPNQQRIFSLVEELRSRISHVPFVDTQIRMLTDMIDESSGSDADEIRAVALLRAELIRHLSGV